MSWFNESLASTRGNRIAEFLSQLGHLHAWNSPSRRAERPRVIPDASNCASADSVAFADLGWLGLCDDAGGHSQHVNEVTFLGVTPDDFDLHDADGGDLSWISLSR